MAASAKLKGRMVQRMRAHLARLAVATELLIRDREYEVAHKAREKAGICHGHDSKVHSRKITAAPGAKD